MVLLFLPRDSTLGELASLLLSTCDRKNLRGDTCVYTELGSWLAPGRAVPCPGPLIFSRTWGWGNIWPLRRACYQGGACSLLQSRQHHPKGVGAAVVAQR